MTAIEIVTHVALLHGLTRRQLVASKRSRGYTWARWEAMARLRRLGLSLPQIGRALGGRHHTTVLYGLRMFDALLARRRQRMAVSGVTRRDWLLRYLLEVGHVIHPASLVAGGAGL